MSYNGCKIKDYSRINPNTGAGFILSRLWERDMTRREVYEGTHYGHWTPGYHSSIWAKLLEDGLIAPYCGFEEVKIPDSYWHLEHNRKGIRAKQGDVNGKRTVVYFITKLGRQTLEKMNARLAAVKKEKQEFCKRNGIHFGTGKPLTKDEIAAICKNAGLVPVEEAGSTLPCPLPYTHATNTPVDPTRTPESGPEALDKLEHFNPDLAARLDAVIRELQELRYSL